MSWAKARTNGPSLPVVKRILASPVYRNPAEGTRLLLIIRGGTYAEKENLSHELQAGEPGQSAQRGARGATPSWTDQGKEGDAGDPLCQATPERKSG